VKVLVLGAGGREHALTWRLAQDPDVRELLAGPGNPGMARVPRSRCVPVDLTSPAAVLALAEREAVDLTVVGPEAPLERGVVDVFRGAGRAIVGPTAQGAALECSKAFAKAFMERHRVPTARFRVVTDLADALDAVAGRQFGFPVVVKADGLAAGKGVVIAENRDQAERAVRDAMQERRFGDAGSRLVIEECLTGPEVSFFVVCDGARAVPLGTAQDHKRIFDDDRGPNTGGMGAFAPSPLISPPLFEQVMRDIVGRVMSGARADGDPYAGFLYVSLMLTPAGPRVIEFNVRFGDPEAQAVMPILEGSFARVLMGSATGKLTDGSLRLGRDRTVGVVLAARGYPGSVESGQVIRGIERAEAHSGVVVFHAGTREERGQVVTAGGRVLTVVARGADYPQAMERAYAAAAEIHFDGMQYRHDIGRKAVQETYGA
jgi:phosphoribosylamine--glycine ligase